MEDPKLSHRWLFYHKRIRGGKVKVLARAAHVPVRGCAKRQRSRRQALSRVGLTTLHIHVGLATLHVRMGDARSEHVSLQQALQLCWLQQRENVYKRLCSALVSTSSRACT